MQNITTPATPPSDLRFQIQALQQDAAFIYLMNVVRNWQSQASNDVMGNKVKDEDKPRVQGEWEAYGRLLNLPSRIIKDLEVHPESTYEDFDPYKS